MVWYNSHSVHEIIALIPNLFPVDEVNDLGIVRRSYMNAPEVDGKYICLIISMPSWAINLGNKLFMNIYPIHLKMQNSAGISNAFRQGIDCRKWLFRSTFS